MNPSFRSQLVYRRTYSRPLEGGRFEKWGDTVERVISHQRWLWERALGRDLNVAEDNELHVLKGLMLDRKVVTSGRTLWLGGTKVAQTREASQFNCAFLRAETVFDLVDSYWLLLQGCGVGFEPVVGALNGFNGEKEITVIRSTRTVGDDQSYYRENNSEFSKGGRHWIVVGDSAEAWAKAVGKILAWKGPEKELVLDLSNIRAAGERLKGYGWLSQGDAAFSTMLENICHIMNLRQGELLSRVDIVDIMNMLGTSLSSRRAAEIAVMPVDDPEALDFAMMKKDYWQRGKNWRAQSNNSLMFNHRPSKLELMGIFQLMLASGGSEPGFINATAAKKRAPWFKGVNPCAEIMLPDKGFCNLVEVDWSKFDKNNQGRLLDAIYFAARANYRQTCVNLNDGVLSDTWHQANEYLRLCGVGATGVVKWLKMTDGHPGWAAELAAANRKAAHQGADSMATELNMPPAKAITTIKPSGTVSKVMDTTEGVHKPIGKYIFNNINFGKLDPIIPKLRAANYHMFDNPLDPEGVVVRVPISYPDVEFDRVGNVEVNFESAVSQLERYKFMMTNYVDHNCSITVSYIPEEIKDIVDWLHENWDSYVGVSFILRADPTKTAADLGYPYLPQEVVTGETYHAYVSQLLPVDFEDDMSEELLELDDCAGGACPIR